MVKLAINLLPWRQKRRDRLQAEFLKGLGVSALVAILMLVVAWQFYQSEIDNQVARNQFLSAEIELLDGKIREIRGLTDNVFFEKLSLKGEGISVTGVAKDNSRISNQLRNFENSAWFASPNVTSISALPQAGPEASRFSLSVEISAPGGGDGS